MNTSQNKESFLLYKSFFAPTKHLSLEDKGRLYDAIFQYQETGVDPEDDNPIKPFFLFFKNQFRLDDKKYNDFLESQREKARKSVEARKANRGQPELTAVNHGQPTQPVSTYNENENENDNVNEKDNNTEAAPVDKKSGYVDNSTKVPGVESAKELLASFKVEPDGKKHPANYWQSQALVYKKKLQIPEKDMPIMFKYFKENLSLMESICSYVLESSTPIQNPVAYVLHEYKRRRTQ